MQADQSEKVTLSSLIHKIKRLRRKLLSYGWSRQQTASFILYQFLKLPEADWQNPSTTVSYYQAKQKYKSEAGATELIVCLQQILPNIHNQEILQYLHSVFQYSAISYGFDLFDSSSDSGENPRLLKRSNRHHRPFRTRVRHRETSPATRKKIHFQQQKLEVKQSQQQSVCKEQHRISRKRRPLPHVDLQELEKDLKKDEV